MARSARPAGGQGRPLAAAQRDLRAPVAKRDLRAPAAKRDLRAPAPKRDARAPAPKRDARAPVAKRDARAPAGDGAERPRRGRKGEPAARRQAILDAALLEFAECGFDATRLDDVARRAGIAKGTLYLYFADKEELFEEVLRRSVSPLLERVGSLLEASEMPLGELLDRLFALFEREVLATRRKLLIRLIIAEGPRFPRIAAFYHRSVVARIMPLIARMARRAAERGELATGALARFPQLLAAPLLLAIVWDGLFSAIEPLDVKGFFAAHREAITGRLRRVSS